MDMKKIFTFILLAISTLAMAQAYPGDPGRVAAASSTTDAIVFSSLGISSTISSSQTFAGRQVTTNAQYSGKVCAGTDDTYIRIRNNYQNNITCTKSVGTINTITIHWYQGSGSYQNNNGISKLLVYAKHTAYNGTAADVDANDQITTATYNGSSSTVINVAAIGSYEYFAIRAAATAIITGITIDWNIPTPHTVTINNSTPSLGTVTTSTTSAAEGVNVTITLTPDNEEEIEPGTVNISSTCGGNKTLTTTSTSSPYTYRFTMPNCNVTVNASFVEAPEREDNYILPGQDSYTLFSGLKSSFTYHVAPGYDGQISYTSSDTKIVTVDGARQEFTALAQGSAVITITASQTDNYLGALAQFVVNVRPREISLFAVDSDNQHWAVTTNLNKGNLAAKQVNVINNKIVNDDSADLKWYLCISGTGYTIQNAGGYYLVQSDEVLALSQSPYVWIRTNDDEPFTKERGQISYNPKDGGFRANNEAYSGINNYTTGAVEGGFITLEEVTPRTGLNADEFTTICLPYAFYNFDSNVKFYNMDDVEEKKDGLHFYFCEEDFNEVSSEPGRPYIVKNIAGSNIHLYKDSEKTEAASAGNYRGLKGTFSRYAFSGAPDYTFGNVLVITGGQIKWANSGSGANANRAYILYNQVPTTSECGDSGAASVSRRVVLSTEQIEEPQVPTSIENTTADQINWNEPVYNVMGQRVARGTTGVLVQNGQKFIAL